MDHLAVSRHSQATPAIEALENRLYRSADLTGVFAGNTPSALQTADRNRVAILVENRGDATAAGLVTVDLYAATGSTPDEGSVLLASATRHVKLKPGGESTVKFRFAGPVGLQDGSYSLLAQIDAGAIPAAIATNDIVTAPSPVQVKQPFVDLTAQDVVGPIKPISIDNNMVRGGPASVEVANRGTETAVGTLQVDYYLSTNPTLDKTAFLAGETATRPIALKPGGNVKLNAVLDPPTTTPAGNYFLFAVLVPKGGIVQNNPADEVGEADRLVIVVRTNHTVPPQSGPAEIFYDGTTIDCAPGGIGETTPCPPADSAPCNNPPPCTAPTTCPTTAPAANCDPPADSTPQDSSDASDSSGGSDSSDSSDSTTSSSNPQQAPPVDASVPPAGDNTSDPAPSDGSPDGGQQDPPPSDLSGNSDQSDGSNDQPAPDDPPPPDDSGGDDGSDNQDTGD